jgi:hypothetical protein
MVGSLPDGVFRRCLSMIFSDLPSPAEASSRMNGWLEGFAQAGKR